jgi:hypothetical protein
VAFSGVGPDCLLVSLDWSNIILLRVFLHAKDPGPIELPLQCILVHQFDEHELDL